MKNAADRIFEVVRSFNTPVCIGLDPFWDLIPEDIRSSCIANYGDTFDAVGQAILAFNKEIISVTEDLVGIYKPQIAFYEQYGVAGYKAFYDTVSLLKKKGKVVIVDAKRGDIGTTASAYSSAYLGKVVLPSGREIHNCDADFLTVNGYLGKDGIEPFIADVRSYAKGVFVLAKTSNPSSGDIQDLQSDGLAIYMKMAKLIEKLGESNVGDSGYSSVGIVMGTTYPSEAALVRRECPKTLFLVPGYGAQGGKGKDVVKSFDSLGFGAVVNSSRQILYAYRSSVYQGKHFRDAARCATLDMIEDIRTALRSA